MTVTDLECPFVSVNKNDNYRQKTLLKPFYEVLVKINHPESKFKIATLDIRNMGAFDLMQSSMSHVPTYTADVL